MSEHPFDIKKINQTLAAGVINVYAATDLLTNNFEDLQARYPELSLGEKEIIFLNLAAINATSIVELAQSIEALLKP